MKHLLFLFCLLTVCSAPAARAQEGASLATARPILVNAVVEGTDTIPEVYIDQVEIFAKLPHQFERLRDSSERSVGVGTQFYERARGTCQRLHELRGSDSCVWTAKMKPEKQRTAVLSFLAVPRNEYDTGS